MAATIGLRRLKTRRWAVAVNSARFRWNKLIESIGLLPGTLNNDRSRTNREDDLLAIFRRWHKPILELIEATEESVIIRTEIYDRRPLNRWSEQTVTLLGDAACLSEQPARAAADE